MLEFAGAGSLGLFWLHAVGGSSRTILEATDRYAATSLADLLGGTPEQVVARETAVDMATHAYRRAMRLTDGAADCLGVGCTAAIATDRARRGADRCWIAVRDRDAVAWSMAWRCRRARAHGSRRRRWSAGCCCMRSPAPAVSLTPNPGVAGR